MFIFLHRYTYEVAPVFTLMEREVIEKSLELIGYPSMPDSDGIMTPGGSISNMYGMVLARYKKKPEVKTKGLCTLPILAGFTSESGHYSIMKGAHWLGLGTDNIHKVQLSRHNLSYLINLEISWIYFIYIQYNVCNAKPHRLFQILYQYEF